MHPHIHDVEKLSDHELEERILKLNRYYHITANPDVRQQMILVLDDLKLEMEARRAKQKLQQENSQDGENGLDSLINIS